MAEAVLSIDDLPPELLSEILIYTGKYRDKDGQWVLIHCVSQAWHAALASPTAMAMWLINVCKSWGAALWLASSKGKTAVCGALLDEAKSRVVSLDDLAAVKRALKNAGQLEDTSLITIIWDWLMWWMNEYPSPTWLTGVVEWHHIHLVTDTVQMALSFVCSAVDYGDSTVNAQAMLLDKVASLVEQAMPNRDVDWHMKTAKMFALIRDTMLMRYPAVRHVCWRFVRMLIHALPDYVAFSMLNIAAEHGAMDMCIFLIGHIQVHIKTQNDYLFWGLYAAAHGGQLETCKLLYNAKQQRNSMDCHDMGRIIDEAAENGHICVVEWMVGYLQPLATPIEYCEILCNALSTAAREGDAAMCEWVHGKLTEAGHTIDLSEYLRIGVVYREYHVCRWCLEAGASPASVSKDMLDAADAEGYVCICQLLAAHAAARRM